MLLCSIHLVVVVVLVVDVEVVVVLVVLRVDVCAGFPLLVQMLLIHYDNISLMIHNEQTVY